MSVLIKGMDEIPDDGSVLTVKHDDDGKVYIKYAGMMGYRMELVELPENHGRLIDADAFAEFIEDAIKSQRYKYVTVDGTLTVADVLTAVIDDLKGNTIVKYESNPTVIEAEDEE